MVLLIIISCLFWALSFLAAFRKMLLAPAFSYLGLLTLSFARKDGYALLPVNNTILWSWLGMTVFVMAVTMLQPDVMNRSVRGVAYIIGGAVVGMFIGLLGYSFTYDVSLLYGIMITCTAVGSFLGFLLYTGTPTGRPFAPKSGFFFKYLTAKGFPVAITVMQLGLALVIAIALHNIGSL